jgi:hypothetical protein
MTNNIEAMFDKYIPDAARSLNKELTALEHEIDALAIEPAPGDELRDAELAFYDAYTNGSHAAWVHESERLALAIERRYNLAKVRCPHCAGEECSHL